MAALATLMYAPVPIQDCLSSGTVNRHSSSSAQCTLENLRPALQHFPTLWRTLVAACFGQDSTCNFLGPKTKNMFGNSDLSDYLNWRENIFLSTGRDTSLLQMLPCWFSKAVRRLIQLYVQGPLGWQSLAGVPAGDFPLRDIDFFVNADEHAEISAISWEAAIQKHVEELYASSLETFLLLFFSELGDKTFFIAALLAAKNSSAVVFIGTFGALALEFKHHRWKCCQVMLKCSRGILIMKIYHLWMTAWHSVLLVSWSR